MDWENVAEWFAQPSSAVALGQAAQAFMGPHQNSFPAQLGAVGAGLGKSRIAQRANAQRQEQLASLIAALGGTPTSAPAPPPAKVTKSPLTPEGEAGPTERTEKADGTYVEKGNVTKTQPSGPVAQPAPVASNVDPGNALLPFSLARAVLGGASSPDLFGLTPEEINRVANTDLAQTALLNQAVGDIFTNMAYQAQAQPAPAPTTVTMEVNGQVVPVPIDEVKEVIDAKLAQAKAPAEYAKVIADINKIEAETGAIPEELAIARTNAEANMRSSIASQKRADVDEKALEFTEMNAETMAKQVDVRADELERLKKKDRQQYEYDLQVHTANAQADPKNVADAAITNELANPDQTSFFSIRPEGLAGGLRAKPYSLPVVNTPDGPRQLTMADVRAISQGEPVVVLNSDGTELNLTENFKGNYSPQEILNIFANRFDKERRQ